VLFDDPAQEGPLDHLDKPLDVLVGAPPAFVGEGEIHRAAFHGEEVIDHVVDLVPGAKGGLAEDGEHHAARVLESLNCDVGRQVLDSFVGCCCSPDDLLELCEPSCVYLVHPLCGDPEPLLWCPRGGELANQGALSEVLGVLWRADGGENHRAEEFCLVTEDSVDSLLGSTCLDGDLADGGGGVSVGEEQVVGGFENDNAGVPGCLLAP
jgi:hypothetical protein